MKTYGGKSIDEIRKAYHDDGVVILRNALTEDETERLRIAEAELRALHDASGAEVRDARFYRGEWPNALADVQRWGTLVELAAEFLGPDIALFHRRFLIKDSIFSGAVTAHQEMPYFHGGLNKFNVFLAVSPNTVENGHLRYFAGSHKYGLVGQGDIQPHRFAGIREVSEELYPGDLALMDHCTWHYSADSQSADPRFLLQLMYQPASDGSFCDDNAELVKGSWRTELRFPRSEALTFYNVSKYVEENKILRSQVDELKRDSTVDASSGIRSFFTDQASIKTRLFALTSWGNSGVPWIVKCLNLHPEIRAFLNARPTIGAISRSDLAATEYLMSLSSLTHDQQLCGDVNGISPHEFAELDQRFGGSFRGAHLTGPPILRYAGSLAYSKAAGRHWSHQTFLDLWGFDRNHPLSAPLLEILGEEGDHVPAHYMMHVNAITQLIGTAPLFRIDRLMTSDEEWGTLVEHLSGGIVKDYGRTWRQLQGQLIGVAHEPFLPFVQSLDGHSRWQNLIRNARPFAAAEVSRNVWDRFPDAVRKVVIEMLTPDARNAYAELGYETSFVPARTNTGF